MSYAGACQAPIVMSSSQFQECANSSNLSLQLASPMKHKAMCLKHDRIAKASKTRTSLIRLWHRVTLAVRSWYVLSSECWRRHVSAGMNVTSGLSMPHARCRHVVSQLQRLHKAQTDTRKPKKSAACQTCDRRPG